ncbi:hypothetical protein ACVGVM_01475 [Pseudonocardia bannensis]|uniref:Small secreted protein n=1 Tax=Pseudonocardia bannensis TaxID=630973 RepID=A0A848DDK8_9PSEU|nr:hypothetical protein [Pseudonocardia bannensis]NMH90662.1 hypothetical protein [Pseudonocardia bannensis]
MPCATRPARLATLLGALFVAAGCSSGVGSAAQGDAVQWTDDVCGAVLQFTEAASTQPSLDAADPAGALRSFSTYLGSTGAAVQGSIDALGRVGPSPVAGGDAVVADLTETLTRFKSSFESARTQIDAADSADPQALSAAFAPLQELENLPSPATGLEANPELNSAAEQAPNCQKVRSATGG